MKVRESGMPEEARWCEFFDPERILAAMGLGGDVGDAVDFGCGYGTFAIPAAGRIRGTLYGFDIEPAMIAACDRLAQRSGLSNVQFACRDFTTAGTGLAPASVDYAMLFNILHAEDPRALLREAHRILCVGGKVGIMHWNYDPLTPRGPPMEMRPKPEQCQQWTEQEGFVLVNKHIGLPPYHFGMVGQKGCR